MLDIIWHCNLSTSFFEVQRMLSSQLPQLLIILRNNRSDTWPKNLPKLAVENEKRNSEAFRFKTVCLPFAS